MIILKNHSTDFLNKPFLKNAANSKVILNYHCFKPDLISNKVSLWLKDKALKNSSIYHINDNQNIPYF